MKDNKTNAMRILEGLKIDFDVHTYDVSDGMLDGGTVAQRIGADPARVFKTLVTQGKSRAYYVFVIPVLKELNLKAAAASVGEKSVEMIPQKELLKTTGYIHGGCSPVGMKKQFKTDRRIGAGAGAHMRVCGAHRISGGPRPARTDTRSGRGYRRNCHWPRITRII